jgi:ABC-type transport system involved in cytochrome c biogenesis permease subunit
MRAPDTAPGQTPSLSPAGAFRLGFFATLRLEIAEAFRARWFAIYAVVFFALVGVLLTFGLTESRVLGFTGLSRTLVTYIQLTMAIVPIFILITTVRSPVIARPASSNGCSACRSASVPGTSAASPAAACSPPRPSSVRSPSPSATAWRAASPCPGSNSASTSACCWR